MALQYHFEVFGEKQVSRSILRMTHHARDARPLWLSLLDDLAQIEEKQFDSEGQFSGGWAQLADSTVEGKAAAGLDPRILHATLALRESLTNIGGDGNVHIVEPHFMVFGSDVPYGKFHQTGTKNMPQRRPVEISAGDRTLMVKKLQRWLFRGEVGAL